MDSTDSTILLTTKSAQSSAELALVLEARSIPVWQERFGRLWVLRVPREWLADAEREIEAYALENRGRPKSRFETKLIGSGWPGVILYLAVLVAVTAASRELALGLEWLDIGRMESARLRAGEWWRATTALTLHADTAHLLGNAVFGSFFGFWIGRSFGAGFGWLLILATGIAGNVLNGLVTDAAHRSIGASTAVFGALGLLTAFSWRRGFPRDATARERIAPIVAGLGLLAFTGAGGENTDIGAHLMGFVCGFIGGLVVARTGAPTKAPLQAICGAAALALVALAWAWGVTQLN